MVLSPKKLQILKAQAFSFPMIYIMLGYEKIDFLTFFDVQASKWPQNELGGSKGEKSAQNQF